MRYLTPAECTELGVVPYAVYGGNVHSLKGHESGIYNWITVYGSDRYRELVKKADALGKRTDK